jgi:hypothetical protein
MRSFVRKMAVTGGVAAVLLAAGGTTAATTAHAAGATAVVCTVSGTATLTPPLGSVPPTAETFPFAGTAVCHGVIGGVVVTSGSGPITGTGYCLIGSLATCVPGTDPACGTGFNIDYRVAVAGAEALSGCGVLTQQGAFVQVHGTANGTDVVSAHVVFTPPVGALPPYPTVTFTGTTVAAGSA